jgi:hypothetical protein
MKSTTTSARQLPMQSFQAFIKGSVQLAVDGKPFDSAKHFVAVRIDMQTTDQR